MKFALNLLTHTQSKVVLQTPKITDILSGDFSSRMKDSTQRNEIFFDNVVKNLPDAIIIANQQFQCVTCNEAFKRIFHTEPIEGNVKEFFESSKFGTNVTQIFTDPQMLTNVEYMADDSTRIFISIYRIS